MIRDILRLKPPPEIFLEKCLDDLEFIDNTLTFLTGALSGNSEKNHEADQYSYTSDTEWQFSQLLTEFSLDSSPFSPRDYPETRAKIAALRVNSEARRKTLEEAYMPVELVKTEPVVTTLELSGLLGGN